ncbi:MAG: PRC-barrel domain-containing protein [Actinomycetota bacterium]|nr:PRC-barrel domain-containing protein [Actinomycetota bacterium]
MSTEERGSSSQNLEDSYKDYTVYDQHYEKIGKVNDLFVDDDDQPEYIGIKQGLLGTKSTLVPMEIARVNDKRELIEIASDKETIENAPTFKNDTDITPDHEAEVHRHFGLQRPDSWSDRSGYSNYYDDEERTYEPPVGAVDTEYGERREESQVDSTQSTSSDRDTYDTSPSRSSEASQRDLDIPLEDSERESSGSVGESDESSSGSRVTFGGPDEDGPSTGESRDSGGIRVYKRARR